MFPLETLDPQFLLVLAICHPGRPEDEERGVQERGTSHTL